MSFIDLLMRLRKCLSIKSSFLVSITCSITLCVIAVFPLKGTAKTQFQQLTNPALLKFELIYVAPGNGTYSLFGHLAVRVKDKKKDRIFDLGITRNMGLKGLANVALGKALFHGEARSFPYMLKSWKRRDRSVIAYPLQLTSRLKTALLLELESRLEGIAKPYLYDPLRANCATQLRQALDNVSGGLVTAGIKQKSSHYQFRDDTRDGYAQALGVLIAIELIVGTSLDQNQSAWASTYRPISLVKQLQRLRLAGVKLLGSPKNYYIRQGKPTTGGVTIYYIIGLFSCLSILLTGLWWRRQNSIQTLLQREDSQGERSTEDHSKKQSFKPSLVQSLFNVLRWFGYYLSSLLLICLFMLALYLSVFSTWIEVRNSWLLVLGSPFDLLLLTYGPWSSLSHQRWLKEAFKQRIAISTIMTLIFGLFLTTLPTITLALGIFLLWGTCLLIVSGLGSLPRGDDHKEVRELIETPASWLDG